MNALAFDYQNADAVGLVSMDEDGGKAYQAGLIIKDKDRSSKPASNVNRILLNTVNGHAGLTIKDPQGKPRIEIAVDSLGVPVIRILSKEGKVVKQLSNLK